MRPRLWLRHAPCDDDVDALSRAAGVSRVLAQLLWLRGLRDAESVAKFLTPSLEDLHDPFRLADMMPAVVRIEAAIARQEPIAVHGDYDVDGITSTVMLKRALELLGARVQYFIPERFKDGYGLQVPAVERLASEGVRLLVSVDCGIRSQPAAARAREVGLDLIITDHHEPEAALPPAVAVINPKRADCAYPDKFLAGAGVALKLVQALCARAGRSKWLPSFVKVAALGTLADVVPLVGENRVIAKLGLAGLSIGPNNVGLRMLLESTRLAGRAIDSHHVAYVLAPRINAAGRMSTPDLAARLLLLTDERLADEARDLASRLSDENTRRQQEEQGVLEQAKRQIERDPDVGAHNMLVLAGDQWHRGIIGIVASKLVDAFHKPVIVLSVEQGLAQGSCRSIPSFDMLAALDTCADLFERYGGHRQAAGFTLDAARLGELRQRLYAHADGTLNPDDLRPRLHLDASLRFTEITPDLVEALNRLAPFGCANPRPVFEASGIEILGGPSIMKERHLSMTVRQEGRLFRAVAWRSAERLPQLQQHRQSIDLAFSVAENSWRGNSAIELEVADIRIPSA
ncbi:MAG: single-stranded-DNA-specific exonuclease RecJ [Vicinamibacterales bacterium]